MNGKYSNVVDECELSFSRLVALPALSDQCGMAGPSLVAGAHDPQIPS